MALHVETQKIKPLIEIHGPGYEMWINDLFRIHPIPLQSIVRAPNGSGPFESGLFLA